MESMHGPVVVTKFDVKRPELLGIKQLCERFGVGRSTIYYWVEHNEFPKPVHIGSRASRWLADEVEEYIVRRVTLRNSRR